MERKAANVAVVLIATIMLLAGYTMAIAAHPDVTVKDAGGAAVTGKTPYSPKQTCGVCHLYESTDTATVSKTQGRLNMNGNFVVDTYNVQSPAHGVSVGYHMQQGRNEGWTNADRTGGVIGSKLEQHFFSSSPAMFGRYCPPSNRQLVSPYADFASGGNIVDTLAKGMEVAPSEFEKTCGPCHVGGGFGEYDRNMNPYSANSQNGDRYVWRWTHINPSDGNAIGGQIVDTAANPGTELTGTNIVEVDCLVCHMADARPMAAFYKSMGCGQPGGLPGPRTDPNCSRDPNFSFTAGQIYDIYNRNMAMYNGWFDIAATAGLGVLLNPQTGALMTDTPTTIPGASIAYVPKSENCAQCHARVANTLGFPNMSVMRAGFGNYARFTPGINDSGYNMGFGFDPDNGMDANGQCTGAGKCQNANTWFELGCKTGMGKRSQKTGDGGNENWNNMGAGLCAACNQMGWTNPFVTNPSTAPNICMNPALKTGCEMMDPSNTYSGAIAGKMPDYDVHDASSQGILCSTCHYPVSGSIAAKNPYGLDTIPAETIQAIDHQFAKGYSKLEHTKDNLDGTVTCAGCHIAQDQPSLAKNGGTLTAPVPAHSSFPALHFQKIDCRTCHIPSIYSAPGRLKYRDWTVGRFRGLNRNMLDWNFNMLTGTMDPARPMWAWNSTPDGTKITPYLPSVIPLWADGYTGVGSALHYEPMYERDVQSAAELVAAQKNSTFASGPIRLNAANEFPLFDGFSLADHMAIDTKEKIDAMVDELASGTGKGVALHVAATDPRLRLVLPVFDPSHGVAPKQFALGAPEAGGCVMCHSSSDQTSPNYSPHSVGFFDGTYELLKNPMNQLADYDCDQMCGLFGTADCTNPMHPACRTFVGSQLMPGMGLKMDGIDFIQMMTVKEFAYYGQPANMACNPMMQLFDPTNGSGALSNCTPDKTYTRDDARHAMKITLQQSTHNPGGYQFPGLGSANNRVIMPITPDPNPATGQPTTWDQAQICIDPASPNPMQPNFKTCGDGDTIVTVVSQKQFLGYDSNTVTGLQSLFNNIAAAFTWANDKSTNNQVDFNASMSTCPSGACSYSWAFGDGSTGSGATVPHAYATTGTYTVTLTLTDTTTGFKSIRTDRTSLLNGPSTGVTPEPVYTKLTPELTTSVSGFTVNVTDATTNNNGQITGAVKWGDGTADGSITAVGGTATHTYTKAGTYIIRYVVTDSAVDSAAVKIAKTTSVRVVVGTSQGYSISGTVENNASAAILNANATMSLLDSTGKVVRRTSANANGTFTFPPVAPGTYTIEANATALVGTTPTRFTFANVPVTVQNNGSGSSGVTVKAN